MKPELEAKFVEIASNVSGGQPGRLIGFIQDNIADLSPDEVGVITGMSVAARDRMPGQSKIIAEWTTKVIQSSRDTEAQKIG